MKKVCSKKPKVRVSNLFTDRWVLTIHGASPDGDCPYLKTLKQQFQKPKYTVVAVSYETGIHGIHPHWQVYFETAEQCRMKQRLSDLLGEDCGFHLEIAKGTSLANLKYVYGVRKDYELGWIHYAKGHNVPRDYDPRGCENILWLRDNMKPWQQWIYDKLTAKPTYRDILWVWEPEGNVGKSYLAKYLHFLKGAIMTGGKSDDMKHAIARWREITGHYPIIIIIDLARSDTVNRADYKTLEQVKNAAFFTGKYESGMVASINPPHLLVFANKPPKTQYMSADRWVVKRIDPDTHQLVDSNPV